MSRTRTFIAVEVSDLVRSRAADLMSRLRSSDVKVSWVAPENMHITLKFLGDQPDDAVAAICQAVRTGAAGVPAFDFRCHAAGAFPSVERPRTLWLGVTDGLAEFQALHAAIDGALAKQRFSKDRQKFRPHLTLGRVRSAGPSLQQLADVLRTLHDFDGGATEVDEVTVFSSELTRSGPTYDVLARASLADS